MWEMGYLTVLQVRLGTKIGDRHAKDSNAFRKRLIALRIGPLSRTARPLIYTNTKILLILIINYSTKIGNLLA